MWTYLIEKFLDGGGMKSQTSLLGTFLYTAWDNERMPIFKKKSSLYRLGKSSKLLIEVTLLQYTILDYSPLKYSPIRERSCKLGYGNRIL